jgi:hypothetical protein
MQKPVFFYHVTICRRIDQQEPCPVNSTNSINPMNSMNSMNPMNPTNPMNSINPTNPNPVGLGFILDTASKSAKYEGLSPDSPINFCESRERRLRGKVRRRANS